MPLPSPKAPTVGRERVDICSCFIDIHHVPVAYELPYVISFMITGFRLTVDKYLLHLSTIKEVIQ